MITVRTKGVPLKREVAKDAEGFDVFSLDETKFDAFEIALMTLRKAGYVDPPTDPAFERMTRMSFSEAARFDAAAYDKLQTMSKDEIARADRERRKRWLP